MPPKRGRKKKVQPRATTASASAVEISDDEDLRRALEESKASFDEDEKRRKGSDESLVLDDEDEQLKEALKRSLADRDEFDEMIAGPSSLSERLANSGASALPSSASVNETSSEESEDEDDDSSSDAYHSAISDAEEEEYTTRRRTRNSPRRGRRRRNSPRGSRSNSTRQQPNLNSSLLSSAEKNERIRTMFQNGLQYHFSGEEMESCKAVSTNLFQHQRVGLAWMFNKENEDCDGLKGGILADDMGLGKTLTVISLITTNHWDKRPLCKPELGFTRKPFGVDRGNKGKGKVGGKFKPKLSAKELGVGSKLKEVKKKTIGGMFDKFKQLDSSDSESEKENKAFTFGVTSKLQGIKKRLSSSEDEDDEFTSMSKNKNIFSSSSSAFTKKENPIDKVEDMSEEESKMSQEDIMKSMIPTSLDDSDDELKPILNPKLNVDGCGDDSSSDEEPEARPRKRKARIDSEEDEEGGRKTGSLRSTRRRVESDSDDSLPDLTTEVRGEPSKQRQSSGGEAGGSGVSGGGGASGSGGGGGDDGKKMIIPPRQPAERRGRRRATLIVCPTSLMSHWVEQLDIHLDKAVNINFKVHHGSNKALTGADLETFDIVITTYGVLASEYGADIHSPLLRAKWLRVVMDEGHMIKNSQTKTAKAALCLDTLRKWIVTGTPIQNNLLEFWSMINWLKFGAYAGKSNLRHFKNDIIRPCKHGDPRGFQRLQLLIDAVCLRRTKTDKKADGTPLVDLPSKTVITREVELEEVESLIYKLYQAQAQRIVQGYSKRGELLRNYAHIFALMIRLRQLCCHRELIKEMDWSNVLEDVDSLRKQLEEMLSKEEKDGAEASADSVGETEKRLMKQLRDMIRSGVTEDCSICLDDLKTPVITPCGHVFCRACIETVIQTLKPPTCPLCRAGINKKTLLEAGQDDEGEEDVGKATANDMEDIHVKVSSSKVNAVIREMLRIKRDHPEDKVVVVSQFTSFLSIIQTVIKEQGFSFVRLDGTMSHQDRAEAVQVFQSSSESSPTVLLLSLRAGGVGLNLTAANHLLLLDPAWNPAIEWQCFDRIHRLGQTKEVFIYKFITKDSIEERMIQIQNDKKNLISGAFHMPEEERRRQRIGDIRTIFGI